MTNKSSMTLWWEAKWIVDNSDTLSMAADETTCTNDSTEVCEADKDFMFDCKFTKINEDKRKVVKLEERLSEAEHCAAMMYRDLQAKTQELDRAHRTAKKISYQIEDLARHMFLRGLGIEDKGTSKD